MYFPDKKLGAAATLLILLAGCSQKPPQAKPEAVIKPIASIQEIMQSIVDPSGDALWESVETVTTKEGTVEKQPRTDEEWRAVRHHAIALVEGANLLLVAGRQVSHAGKQLEDAHVPGILSAPEIQKAIDAKPAAFHQAAAKLRDAGAEALAAIDAKDVHRLLSAGEKIDHACESCHKSYWYPNDKIPTVKWPAIASANKP